MGLDGAKSIDGISEGIKDSAQHLLSDGDIDDGTGSGDSVSFLDFSKMREGSPVISEDDDTDVVSLEVKGHASDA